MMGAKEDPEVFEAEIQPDMDSQVSITYEQEISGSHFPELKKNKKTFKYNLFWRSNFTARITFTFFQVKKNPYFKIKLKTNFKFLQNIYFVFKEETNYLNRQKEDKNKGIIFYN